MRSSARLLALAALCLPGGEAFAQRLRPSLALDSATVARLVGKLRDRKAGVRFAAADSLHAGGATAVAAVPALVKMLHGRSQQMRDLAVRTLAGIGGPAIPPVVAVLRGKDEHLIYTATTALGVLAIEGRAPMRELAPLLRDPDPRVRTRAVASLRLWHDAPSAEVLQAIGTALADPDRRVREKAVGTLTLAAAAAAPLVPALVHALADANRSTRFTAAWVLGRTGESTALPALVRLLRTDPDSGVRWRAAEGLGLLGPTAGSAAVPDLISTLGSPSTTLRAEAARALGAIGLYRAPPGRVDSVLRAVSRMLADSGEVVRLAAVESLYQLGGPAWPAVLGAVAHPDVRTARRAIALIGYEDPDPVSLGALYAAMSDQRAPVRDAAADAIAGFGAGQRPRLETVATSPDANSRTSAHRALRILAMAHRSPVAERCYELRRTAWVPPRLWGGLDVTSSDSAIRVRFTTSRRFGPYADTGAVSFALEALGEQRGFYQEGSWDTDSAGPRVDVMWSGGYAGIFAQLTAEGDSLRGTGRTFSDDGSEPQRAQFTGVAIPCPPDRR